jgi:hypothetical protein
MNTYAILIVVILTCALFAAAADNGGLALLGPNLLAPVLNTSGAASLPWQETFISTITTDTFFFRSFALNEISALLRQTRGSLHANINNLAVRIRKIPGLDITWRAFVCAETDILNAASDDSADALLHFCCTQPGAIPIHTLAADTTQSSIDFTPEWLLGLGTSVYFNMPPLRSPLVCIFATASASLQGKSLVYTLSGRVDISGYGYLGAPPRQEDAAPAAPSTPAGAGTN